MDNIHLMHVLISKYDKIKQLNFEYINIMKKIFRTILTGYICLGLAGPAFAARPEPFVVNNPTDVHKTCDQLWDEAFAMRAIIERTRSDQADSQMQKRGIGVAGAAAGLLVGTLTGGIGLAAAGLAAGEATDEMNENAEKYQEIAQQRRALMAGMFVAKGCIGDVVKLLQESPQKNVSMVTVSVPLNALKSGYNQ